VEKKRFFPRIKKVAHTAEIRLQEERKHSDLQGLVGYRFRPIATAGKKGDKREKTILPFEVREKKAVSGSCRRRKGRGKKGKNV